jgi:hypothetical protein
MGALRVVLRDLVISVEFGRHRGAIRKALAGRLRTDLAGEGLMTIPSFHVVFAVLFTWVSRQERLLYPFAIVVNLGVIAAAFPVGWHYLTDVAAGMIWVAVTIAVVRRIQGAPARSAGVQKSTPTPLQRVLGEGGSS